MLKGLDDNYCQKVSISDNSSFLGTLSKFIDTPFNEMEVNENVVQSISEQLNFLHKGMSKIKNVKNIRKLDTNKTLDELTSKESLAKVGDYFKRDYKRVSRKENVEEFYLTQAKELKSYFSKRKGLLEKPVLNHGDFNLTNFLVINNRIEKIFDFDEMIFAPLEYEVAIAIYHLNYPQEFYLDQLIELFLKGYYQNGITITQERVKDVVMFMKYRAFYRFARYFTYYQFTQTPGGHFTKFQDIIKRLDQIDTKQIYEFINKN